MGKCSWTFKRATHKAKRYYTPACPEAESVEANCQAKSLGTGSSLTCFPASSHPRGDWELGHPHAPGLWEKVLGGHCRWRGVASRDVLTTEQRMDMSHALPTPAPSWAGVTGSARTHRHAACLSADPEAMCENKLTPLHSTTTKKGEDTVLTFLCSLLLCPLQEKKF